MRKISFVAFSTNRGVRFASALLALLTAISASGEDRFQSQRREMTARAIAYLVDIQNNGYVGDARPRAVTGLFVLACLSSGIMPTHPVYGDAVQAAADWIMEQSPGSFLGGSGEPNSDHALAALAVTELVGSSASVAGNLALFEKARQALEYSLQSQDQGSNPDYNGGWKADDRTRVNDRMLTAWFLTQMRAAAIINEDVPESRLDQAAEFMAASQKSAESEKEDERGGFSISAAGLPVRSATASGMAVLAMFDPDKERLELARAWLSRHSPNWYGPNFYPTHFFAARALFRTRELDGGKAFDSYFQRVARMLRERQAPDGSFPFPPGEGGTTVAMGTGFSTAMAVLILNADRGFLPVDQ